MRRKKILISMSICNGDPFKLQQRARPQVLRARTRWAGGGPCGAQSLCSEPTNATENRFTNSIAPSSAVLMVMTRLDDPLGCHHPPPHAHHGFISLFVAPCSAFATLTQKGLKLTSPSKLKLELAAAAAVGGGRCCLLVVTVTFGGVGTAAGAIVSSWKV